MAQIFDNKALKIKWELHRTPKDLEDWLRKANLSQLVVDTESTGLDYFSTLLGISMYDGLHHPIYAAPRTKYWESDITEKDFKEITHEYLPKALIIAHNAKYDRGVFKVRNFFHDWNILDDTSLLIHAWDPDMKKQLEFRVKEDFKYDKQKFDLMVAERMKSKKKVKWENIAWSEQILEWLAEYSCEDVYWEYEIWKKYSKKVYGNPEIYAAYKDIEIPLIFTLSDMETRGIRVDIPFLEDLGNRCVADKADLERDIFDTCGCEFNLNSPKQLCDVIYGQMKLPVLKSTATGAASTDGDTMKMLAQEGYEIANKLVEYSELDTLMSSFVMKIPRLVDKNNILRCSFNQDITRTGRLSSSNPNLQNQPNNERYPVRKAYIPREGYTFLVYDYSQIEPRIMAHMSRDPKMLEVFNSGSDIYNGISTELGVERKVAKVIQLATSYGMGPDKLQHMLGITLNEAKMYMDAYKRTYKVYYRWKKQVEDAAVRDGYTTTMFGSRRLLPDVKSANRGVYFSALRKAVNTPVQGSAAQIIKIAMNNTQGWFRRKNIDAHLLLSVHDELVIEVKTELVHEIIPMVIRKAEKSVELDVPIIAELKICSDWSQMKDKTFEGLDLSKVAYAKKEIQPCLTVAEMLQYGII
jgi:DNA polymerase-1